MTLGGSALNLPFYHPTLNRVAVSLRITSPLRKASAPGARSFIISEMHPPSPCWDPFLRYIEREGVKAYNIYAEERLKRGKGLNERGAQRSIQSSLQSVSVFSSKMTQKK